jgi:flavorubredoxin
MKRVLIAYFSPGGVTEEMAGYIAEGVRFGGDQAEIKKISEIKKAEELAGYDGYILGSPTYSLDVPEPMKKFLLMVNKAGLEGKLGGAFGSYTHDVAYKHDDYAPAIIFNALRDAGKMEAFELGPFHLQEELVATAEGIKTCQDYGKNFSQALAG